MKVEIIKKLIDDRIQITSYSNVISIKEYDEEIWIIIDDLDLIIIKKTNILYMSGITIVKIDNELIV